MPAAGKILMLAGQTEKTVGTRKLFPAGPARLILKELPPGYRNGRKQCPGPLQTRSRFPAVQGENL